MEFEEQIADEDSMAVLTGGAAGQEHFRIVLDEIRKEALGEFAELFIRLEEILIDILASEGEIDLETVQGLFTDRNTALQVVVNFCLSPEGLRFDDIDELEGFIDTEVAHFDDVLGVMRDPRRLPGQEYFGFVSVEFWLSAERHRRSLINPDQIDLDSLLIAADMMVDQVLEEGLSQDTLQEGYDGVIPNGLAEAHASLLAALQEVGYWKIVLESWNQVVTDLCMNTEEMEILYPELAVTEFARASEVLDQLEDEAWQVLVDIMNDPLRNGGHYPEPMDNGLAYDELLLYGFPLP